MDKEEEEEEEEKVVECMEVGRYVSMAFTACKHVHVLCFLCMQAASGILSRCRLWRSNI